MKNDRHNSRGKGEKKIVVYNSNGAKSPYEVCTGKIHRRIMEILCAGSCRGNARGMRWKGAENLFPSFLPFFLRRKPHPFPVVVNATANPRLRVVMGYGYL